jgi:hypothetical protein
MRDPATAAGIREIRAIRRVTAPVPAAGCPGVHPRPLTRLTGRRYTAELTRTGRRRLSGRISVPGLGTGGIEILGGRIMLRSFTTGSGMIFRARFSRGRLFACLPLQISPARGGYRWTGIGAILHASPPLRRYSGLTLRFDGFTPAGDLTKLRADMTTDDPPTGFRC